jgi:hypothetical protein
MPHEIDLFQELMMSTRLLVFAVTPIMMAATLTVGSPVAVTATHVSARPSAALAATPTANTEAQASTSARATGHRVETLGQRTETRQVFANPDGTFTAETSLEPRWIRAGAGWTDVDTTLRARPDGTIGPVATPLGMTFSGGGDNVLAVISDGGRSVATTWQGVLPTPILNGAVATYPSVLADVDLRVTASVEGFSEVLVVKTPRAAANPALRGLTFGVHGSGVTVKDDGVGGLSAVSTSGERLFASSPPRMWDASGNATTLPRSAVMPQHLAGGMVTVRPDAGMLSDAHAEFPIYIDPDWTGSKLAWTYVDKAWHAQAYGLSPSGNADVGYYAAGTKRSFFRMNSTGIAGKHIISATFRIEEVYSWGCSSAYNTRTDLYLTGSISASTTWDHQPSFISDLAHVYSDYGYASCPANNVEFNVTSAAVTAAKGALANLTFALRAYDEGSTTGWKNFGPSTAKLIVTYNTPPSTPKASGSLPGTPCVVGAARPYLSLVSMPAGTVPSLYTQIYDPDGTADNHGVQAQFEIHHYNTATGVWDAFGSLLTSSFTKSSAWLNAQVAMPALQDRQAYSWHVRAYDGIDYSAWGPSCEFSVDNSAPTTMPQVSSSDYPPGTSAPSGGVGQPGSFTFTVTPSTGVGSFRYALDDASAPSTVTATGGTATVLLTPLHELHSSLHVCPVSLAGVVGTSCATYDFQVGPPTGPVAHWALDDTSGTTASDLTGAHPATLTGGATWTGAGRIAGAAHFDALSGSAVTSGPVMDTSAAFSVSAWVRLNALPARSLTAVSATGTFGSLFYFGYGLDAAGVGRWHIALQTADTDPYGWIYAYSDNAHAPTIGAWTQLVAEFDPASKTIRFYVNGQKMAEVAEPSMWKASGPLHIGNSQWRGTLTDFWNGDIDDVRVYHRVLSDISPTSAYGDADAEIHQLATRPVRPEGWWTLDEGTGNIAADSVGGHTMTGTAAPGWSTSGQFGNAVALNGGTQWMSSSAGLRTDGSFSVAAWVRLDSGVLGESLRMSNSTAVSQNGVSQSPFYLGTRTFNETQPDGTTKLVLRWSFSLSPQDGPTTAFTWQHAKSAVPIDGSMLDQWVLLVGVYDASMRTSTLYVPSTGDYGSVQLPPGLAAWQANGGLQIGQGWYEKAADDWWPGSIDQVRVYTGVLSANDAANLFSDVPPATS